ncbi:sodium:solute symporter family protein [Brevibacterium marinum]|uniref:SSS family solute:Na+ symporter n=1 Tax=Brevibacterium marinum TaxID=418643 RepID=A0A846RN04_9MICO|nr:sodium:solute symporter family protein [Brevibacterium marinum]NJC55244.1 SSS family solute:Na+ symporter [Brevibacterium marinum]
MNWGTTTLISLTAIIVIGIGAYISFYVGKKNKSNDSWVVGGRNLPLYVVAFTQYATAVGGGVLVAHVGIAYAWGFSVFWYELFVVIGLIIISLFAGWLRRRSFSTIPEVFTRLYGEHRLMLSLVALAVIVVPFGWLATQFIAFANLFNSVTGIGITPLIIIMAVVSIAFVLPGGLTSVAWSDFFFGVFMVIASIVVGFYAVNNAGGPGTIMANLPDDLTVMPTGLTAAGGLTILLWLFSILPGTLTNQLYYQRVFAASSVKQARQGIYLSSALIFLSGIYALIIGLSVRSMTDQFGVDGREQAAGWFLAQLPVWLVAIYGAFLMATIVSTTGSALHSVVVNLVNDLRPAFVKRKDTTADLVNVSRWCTVAVSALAALLSIIFPTALNWLVATYAYSASMLAAPFLIGMVLASKWVIHVSVGYVSMVVGLGACAISHVLGTTVPYAVYGILGSLIAYFIMLAVRRPQARATIEEGAQA